LSKVPKFKTIRNPQRPTVRFSPGEKDRMRADGKHKVIVPHGINMGIQN